MPLTLRERLLKDLEARRLAQLRKVRESVALQDLGKGGLFPGEERIRREYLRLQDIQLAKLSESRKALREMKAAVPREKLVATRDRGDYELFRKSGIPRWAAILGLLERERNRNAALTRADWKRAQVLAARSSKADLRQAYRRSGRAGSADASFRGEASFFDLRGVDVDPCVEFLARQKSRRQVMFANHVIRGYRGPRVRRIC